MNPFNKEVLMAEGKKESTPFLPKRELQISIIMVDSHSPIRNCSGKARLGQLGCILSTLGGNRSSVLGMGMFSPSLGKPQSPL